MMVGQYRGRQLVTFMALTALFAVGLSFTPMQWVDAQGPARTRAGKVCQPIARSEIVTLPFKARDVAVHWAGNPEAQVRVAFSTDGATFGEPQDADRDDVGEQVGNGRTYGAILAADGAIAVRVDADRGIGNLCVLTLADENQNLGRRLVPAGQAAGAAVAQPAITPRSAWGAEESYRFRNGAEYWKQEYFPIQKLIVHHTATRNRDPDPKATIRSIYYYHAVEQDWGDIGYNFLIDETGVVYKGRYSSATTADRLDGENEEGKGVRAGHAFGFNAGTVGVAFLGTFTGKNNATAMARSSLEKFLAWEASNPLHVLDPLGSSTYVNPVDGTTKTNLSNIAGHKDVNATECPGGTFYRTLPSVRKNVAGLIAASP